MVEGIALDIAGSGKASGDPGGGADRAGAAATPGILLLATMALLDTALAARSARSTALMRGCVFDASSQTLMLVFIALPEFMLGAILALLFGVVWPILPAVSLEVSFTTLVLPVATLALAAIAYTARFIRAGVIEALRRRPRPDGARLKGLPERRVIRQPRAAELARARRCRRSRSSSAGSPAASSSSSTSSATRASATGFVERDLRPRRPGRPGVHADHRRARTSSPTSPPTCSPSLTNPRLRTARR